MRPADVSCGVGFPDLAPRRRFLQIVDEIFERGWLTNGGPVVAEFERQLAAITGARQVIAVCNATTGLMVALRALDVSGRVAVPAFTFPATAHALQWLGLEPVFCDIDPLTHSIDVQTITEEVSAVIGVHLWGRACAAESVEAFAARRSIPALFDAAHSFGARRGGRVVGRFGRCEVFSFHATKIVSAFEGGAIATDDDELAERIRRMVNFGFAGRDQVVDVGTNAKLSEIHAAMGLASLELFERTVAHNRRNARVYRSALGDLPGVRVLAPGEGDARDSNDNYVVIEVNGDAPLSRDAVIGQLRQAGVDARRYFFPGCHRSEPYAALYPRFLDALEHTDRACATVLQLPTGAATPVHEVERVCEILRRLFDTRRSRVANA